MAASRIVAYRLQRVKADFIVGSKDATNAFPSAKNDKAISTTPTARSVTEQRLFHQRYQCASVQID
eukprot:5594006-Pyramimonas_sp.AAC.1